MDQNRKSIFNGANIFQVNIDNEKECFEDNRWNEIFSFFLHSKSRDKLSTHFATGENRKKNINRKQKRKRNEDVKIMQTTTKRFSPKRKRKEKRKINGKEKKKKEKDKKINKPKIKFL